MNTWRKSPQHLIDLFDAALPADARVQRRKMFGYPAAFVSGHLFCGLHQENLILKLGPRDRETLTSGYGAQMFAPMPGRTMREYLVAPESLLADRDKLAAWMRQSINYVAALPAKVPRVRKARSSEAGGPEAPAG